MTAILNFIIRPRVIWIAVGAVFILGLFLEVTALNFSSESSAVKYRRWQTAGFSPYLENDENIYIALTEQIEAGRGYTLQGHPILNEPWIIREQYDRPLFFHPPGGIAFFWLTRKIAGDAGYALAQVLSFAFFFWSVLLLGRMVLPAFDRIAFLTLAVLAAFTPIMVHVVGRFWLDGPLLGFATSAAAVFLLAIKRRSLLLVFLAAVLLGYASLIKLTAFLVVPGVVALAWAITPRDQQRGLIIRGLLFVAIAGLIQLPWEIWQWRVAGSAFPAWAGKPAEELVRTNRYVHYLTVIRSPWIYVKLLPQVMWTLIPSLVLWAAQWRNRELRNRGAALVFWIAAVAGTHVVLGALGYSKVLRYVILVTPATVVLFALGAGAAIRSVREGRWLAGGKIPTTAILLLAAIGLGLEVAQGLRTSLVDNRKFDLIRPLPVLRAIVK